MGEASEREIRERIEATRARMGDTIEEIGDRVNPDRVQRELKARAREQVDDFKHTVKQKARDKMSDMGDEVTERGRGLWETIKENPIPAGMVGVGLAWLVANGRSHDDDRYDRSPRRTTGGYRGYPALSGESGHRGYPETASMGYRAGYMGATGGEVHARGTGMGAGLDRSVPLDRQYGDREEGRSATERVQDGAEHAAERVRETAEHAADSVREKGSELMDRASEGIDDARHRVEHWADEAQDRARRAERRVEDAVREHPMAAGMVAAALGFAAGLMIPETDKEHQLMGETRDRMLDRAQDTARDAANKAKDIAKDAAGASAERAVEEAWPGGGSSERSGINDPGR